MIAAAYTLLAWWQKSLERRSVPTSASALWPAGINIRPLSPHRAALTALLSFRSIRQFQAFSTCMVGCAPKGGIYLRPTSAASDNQQDSSGRASQSPFGWADRKHLAFQVRDELVHEYGYSGEGIRKAPDSKLRALLPAPLGPFSNDASAADVVFTFGCW